MPTGESQRPGPATVAATLLLWALLVRVGLAVAVFVAGAIFAASMVPR